MKTMATLTLMMLAFASTATASGSVTYTCQCYADYGLSFEDFGPVTVKVRTSLSPEEAADYRDQACRAKYKSRSPRAIQCYEH